MRARRKRWKLLRSGVLEAEEIDPSANQNERDRLDSGNAWM